MKKIIALLISVICSIGIHAKNITSTTSGGNWSTTSTWVGGVVPGSSDSATIATTSGNSVTVNVNETILKITINSGAQLTVSGVLTVNGLLTNNGTIAGTNTINFALNSGTVVTGGGSWSSHSGYLAFTGSNQTIDASVSISKSTGEILLNTLGLAGNVKVTNNGSITLSDVNLGRILNNDNGVYSTTWVNAANSYLSIAAASWTSSRDTLYASGSGNTIAYGGTTAQTLKNPVNKTYYYLTIANSSSILTLPNNLNCNSVTVSSGAELNTSGDSLFLTSGGTWSHPGTVINHKTSAVDTTIIKTGSTITQKIPPSAFTITSTATGTNWGTSSNWVPALSPGPLDTAIIATTSGYSMNGFNNTVAKVVVNSGASLTVNGVLYITNILINNGTVTSTNSLFFTLASGTVIKGSGDWSTYTGLLNFQGAYQVVDASATISAGGIYLRTTTLGGPVKVRNKGSITLTSTTNGYVVSSGVYSSVWINDSNSYLKVILPSWTYSTDTLYASAPGNTIELGGTTPFTIKNPVNKTYYNLTLSNTSSILTLPNNLFGHSVIVSSGSELNTVGDSLFLSSGGTWSHPGTVINHQLAAADSSLVKTGSTITQKIPPMAFSITSTSTGGSWSLTSSWVGNVVPGLLDTAIINTTGSNYIKSNASSSDLIANLIVNSGAILNLGSSNVTVSKLLTNNGLIEGAYSIYFTANTGTVISGTGSWSGHTGIIYFQGSNQVIDASVNMYKTAGSIYLNTTALLAPVKVTNYGSISLSSTTNGKIVNTGSTYSTVWVNGANSYLHVGYPSWANSKDTLYASAGGNTIVFSNTSAYTIKKPVNSTYYNLIDSSGSTLSLPAAITVNGNLQISSGGTLDVTTSNYGLNIGGNFIDNGTFTQRSGTVTFNGTANQTLSGSSTPTFYNFTENQAASTDSAFFTAPITVSHTLTRTQGLLDCQKNQLTNSATPAVSLSPSSATICNGTSTTLTASNYTNYIWSPGTGLSSTTGTSVTANPSSTTSYSVYGSSTGLYTCGVGSDAITVNATPTVSISPSSASICTGSSTSLTASGASTYTWAPSTGLSATTGATVTANPTSTTTYTITGTGSDGCTSTQTLVITVNPLPTISISPSSATICSGNSTSLTASGAITYAWSPSTGLSATTGASVTANPTSSTTYTVVGTDANGCTNNQTVTISVNPSPIVNISTSNNSICSGNSTSLVASGGGTYLWNTGATTQSITISPTSTTTYSVTATNGFGCTGTYADTVIVGNCRWQTNPFDRKVFIQNNGQFNSVPSIGSSILYGVQYGNINIYFTKTGITYQQIKFTGSPNTAQETDMEEDSAQYKPDTSYVSAQWVSPNSSVTITAGGEQSYYYTYPTGYTTTTTTNVYKTLTYQNLYNGIDVVFSFPNDSGGFEYSVIIHHSANPSQVKLLYSSITSMGLDAYGNDDINCALGTLTEHVPSAYYQDGSGSIAASFSLSGYQESFTLASYDTSKTLIIDPWVTNPKFLTFNSAYDLDYDYAGNVYVYGGAGTAASTAPFQLVQLTSTGVKNWVFNAVSASPNASGGVNYGAFTEDKANGISYIVQAFDATNPSGIIYSVTAAGGGTSHTPTITGAGASGGLDEMWRAKFDQCTGNVIIGGGGSYGYSQHIAHPTTNYPFNQAAVYTPTANTLNVVNVLGAPNNDAFQDICIMALDPTSKTTFLSTSDAGGSPVAGGYYPTSTFSCTLPALGPDATLIAGGLTFEELKSVNYVDNNTPTLIANGFNGMTASPKFLYATDGFTLQAWSKTPVTPNTFLTRYNTKVVHAGAVNCNWGGLDVDACDNIYVGQPASVDVYSYNGAAISSKVTSYVTASDVYDVKLGTNDQTLYACGNGFVESWDLSSSSPVSLTMSSTGTCPSTSNGTATAILTLCGNLVTTSNFSGLTYTWSTSPVQTSQTATGLSAGTYIVSISLGGCTDIYTGTVSVPTIPDPPPLTTPLTICSGNSVQLNPSCKLPLACFYSYTWSGGLVGSDPIVSPTTTTSYTYTISTHTSPSCVTTGTVTVNVNPSPTISITGNDLACTSSSGTYCATISGGTTPYNASSYAWSVLWGGTSGTTTSATPCIGSNSAETVTWPNGSDGGNVIFTAKDANGCAAADTFQVGGCCDAVYNCFSESDCVYYEFNDQTASYLVSPSSPLYSAVTGGNTITSASPCPIGSNLYAININGTFTVDQDLKLIYCNIYMGSNAKIVFTNGSKLSLEACHLQACDDMWDGIYVDATTAANNLYVYYSLIEDAQNAVVSIAGGKYDIETSTLNKNYVGIKVEPYNGTHPGIINNSTISCDNAAYSCSTFTATLSTATTLKSPHSTVRSLAGMEISGVYTITVGSSSLGLNTFQDMDCGISSSQSNVIIGNDNFTNMTATVHPTWVNPKAFLTGVYAVGGSSLNNLTVGGSSGAACTFTACNTGVWASNNMNATVNYNSIGGDGISTSIGINFQNDNGATLNAQNNSAISNIQTGINCYGNYGATVMIDHNPITSLNTFTTSFGVKIYETTPSFSTSYIVGPLNTITDVTNGVYTSNLEGAQIGYNSITINGAGIGGTNNEGIFMSNDKQCIVNMNDIYYSSTTAAATDGINVAMGGGSHFITCNLINKPFHSMLFAGPQLGTLVDKNDMTLQTTISPIGYGIYLNLLPTTTLYNQKDPAGRATSNTWTPNGSPAGPPWVTYVKAGNPLGNPTYIYVNPTSGSQSPNVGMDGSSSPYTPIIFVTGYLNDTYTCNPAPPLSSPFHTDILVSPSAALGIINDTNTYTLHNQTAKWTEKHDLYIYLTQIDTSLVDSSTVIKNFRDSARNANIGAIEKINIDINPPPGSSPNLANAVSLNYSMVSPNVAETTYQSVYGILLTMLANEQYLPDSDEAANLRPIASECPGEYGEAVYIARALLSQIDTIVYYNYCENDGSGGGDRPIGPQNENKTPLEIIAKVYPNPANSTLTVQVKLTQNETATICLYNSIGKEIRCETLKNNITILNISDLSGGIYYYRITDNNASLIKADKVIVIH